MTGQKPPLELSFAQVHDIVQGPRGDGRLSATYVMSRCDHGVYGFYDEVSKRRFPNLHALKAGVAAGGRFHLAVHCGKHLWLEKLPDDLIIELWPAISCVGACGRESKCGPGVRTWMCPECSRAGKEMPTQGASS